MFFPLLLLLLLLLVGPIKCSIVQSIEEHVDNRTDIVEVYRYIRSIRDADTHPTDKDALLGLEFKLYHIVDVNDVQQTFDLKARVTYDWYDDRLSWTHLPYRVDKIRFFENGVIWDPEIKIQQTLGMPQYFSKLQFEVSRAGHVKQKHYVILRITCPMSVRDFPFDNQTCKLTFSCTACYFHNILDVSHNIKFFDESRLAASEDMAYKGIGGQQNNKFELANMFISLEHYKPVVTIISRRRYLYSLFYLIAPSLVITAVAFLQFALPPNGGEKVSVGVTCLLSMTVFMIVLQQNLAPDTKDSIPLLGRLFGVLTIVIMLTTAMSSVIIMVHYRGKHALRPNVRYCGDFAFRLP